jgi:hypothetical protein
LKTESNEPYRLAATADGSLYDPAHSVSSEVHRALEATKHRSFKDLPVCLLRRSPRMRAFFRGAKP